MTQNGDYPNIEAISISQSPARFLVETSRYNQFHQSIRDRLQKNPRLFFAISGTKKGGIVMKWRNIKRPVLMCTAIYVLSLLLAPIAVAQETPAAPKVMGEELLTPSGQPGSVEDISLLGDELHKWNKDMDVWFMLMLVAFLMLFIKKFEWESVWPPSWSRPEASLLTVPSNSSFLALHGTRIWSSWVLFAPLRW
jgi:hypothetical protein